MINSSLIKDIAYVFEARKIESGLYLICSKSNCYIIRYKYHKYSGIQVFNNVKDWLPFISDICYRKCIWIGLERVFASDVGAHGLA